jgi:hypothetical protein
VWSLSGQPNISSWRKSRLQCSRLGCTSISRICSATTHYWVRTLVYRTLRYNSSSPPSSKEHNAFRRTSPYYDHSKALSTQYGKSVSVSTIPVIITTFLCHSTEIHIRVQERIMKQGTLTKAMHTSLSSERPLSSYRMWPESMWLTLFTFKIVFVEVRKAENPCCSWMVT